MSTSGGVRASTRTNVPSRPRQTPAQLLKQRGIEATRNLRDALNLPTDLNDAAALGTALAEVAAEESRRNPRFADAVKQRYDDVMRLRTPAPRPTTRRQELPPLVPLERSEYSKRVVVDPFAPPDPHDIIRVYGYHQLNRALQDYTLDMLKQTAANVQAAHPGTKPKSRSSKAAVIDYIVQYSGE
jgi:hypothetical protein